MCVFASVFCQRLIHRIHTRTQTRSTTGDLVRQLSLHQYSTAFTPSESVVIPSKLSGSSADLVSLDRRLSDATPKRQYRKRRDALFDTEQHYLEATLLEFGERTASAALLAGGAASSGGSTGNASRSALAAESEAADAERRERLAQQQQEQQNRLQGQLQEQSMTDRLTGKIVQSVIDLDAMRAAVLAGEALSSNGSDSVLSQQRHRIEQLEQRIAQDSAKLAELEAQAQALHDNRVQLESLQQEQSQEWSQLDQQRSELAATSDDATLKKLRVSVNDCACPLVLLSMCDFLAISFPPGTGG